jgi:hypothetical protein
MKSSDSQVSAIEMMLDAATKLLDEFRALPGRVERPRTFMEIAGYPHYENVCSNILAFFMDPEESHRLGTLVLDALASASNIAAADEGVGGSVSVDREVGTDAGNKIDILITSDDQAILIEKKIYAVASNPFHDYAAYLDRIANGRAKHKLLLTLYPTSEGSSWGFKNLTHEELVGQIRSLLGHYVSGADARHLTMFLDFLNTLENFQRGSRMNQEFVKLLADRGDDIRSLFGDMKNFRADMRSKGEELNSLINVEGYPNIEQGFWNNNIVDMFDNLYYRINVAEDLLVGIDAHLSPHGWEIQIFTKPESREPYHSRLRGLLQRLDIQFEEREWQRWRPFVHDHFDYDANLDEIRPVLQELIDKIATSQEAKNDSGPA